MRLQGFTAIGAVFRISHGVDDYPLGEIWFYAQQIIIHGGNLCKVSSTPRCACIVTRVSKKKPFFGCLGPAVDPKRAAI
jgi:hypothetical protein